MSYKELEILNLLQDFNQKKINITIDPSLFTEELQNLIIAFKYNKNENLKISIEQAINSWDLNIRTTVAFPCIVNMEILHNYKDLLVYIENLEDLVLKAKKFIASFIVAKEVKEFNIPINIYSLGNHDILKSGVIYSFKKENEDRNFYSIEASLGLEHHYEKMKVNDEYLLLKNKFRIESFKNSLKDNYYSFFKESLKNIPIDLKKQKIKVLKHKELKILYNLTNKIKEKNDQNYKIYWIFNGTHFQIHYIEKQDLYPILEKSKVPAIYLNLKEFLGLEQNLSPLSSFLLMLFIPFGKKIYNEGIVSPYVKQINQDYFINICPLLYNKKIKEYFYYILKRAQSPYLDILKNLEKRKDIKKTINAQSINFKKFPYSFSYYKKSQQKIASDLALALASPNIRVVRRSLTEDSVNYFKDILLRVHEEDNPIQKLKNYRTLIEEAASYAFPYLLFFFKISLDAEQKIRKSIPNSKQDYVNNLFKGIEENPLLEIFLLLNDISQCIHKDPEIREQFLASSSFNSFYEKWKYDPKLKNFKEAWEKFLHNFSFRSLNDLEIKNSCFSENPQQLMPILKSMVLNEVNFREIYKKSQETAKENQELLFHKFFKSKKNKLSTQILLMRTFSTIIEYPQHLIGLIFSDVHQYLQSIGKELINNKKIAILDDLYLYSINEIIDYLEKDCVFPKKTIAESLSPRLLHNSGEIILPALEPNKSSKLNITEESIIFAEDAPMNLGYALGTKKNLIFNKINLLSSVKNLAFILNLENKENS